MNNDKLLQNTLAILEKYERDLEHFSLAQLIEKPNENSWSIGQVYIHLCMAAKGFFFKNAESCLQEINTTSGRKNWKGYLIYLFGKMPDMRVKMPAKVAVEPNQPESKEQLIKKLEEIKQLSVTYFSKMASANKKAKIAHPLLGYLDAAEWITLCNYHFKHHELQISRIKKELGF